MKLHTTWSPGLTLVTPGPTSSMTPDPSWPPTIGYRGGRSPSVRCRSEWHSTAAVVFIVLSLSRARCRRLWSGVAIDAGGAEFAVQPYWLYSQQLGATRF